MIRHLLSAVSFILALTVWPLHVLAESAGKGVPMEGRIRLNYGAQDDNGTNSLVPTQRGTTYVNRLLQGIFRYRSKSVEAVFDGYARQKDGNEWNALGHDTTLNQLFGSLAFGNGYKLKIGRQRALWGHGFAYVPTDFINPPLDPAGLDLANAKGVDSVTLDIYHGQTTLTLLHNHDKTASREGYGLKLTNSSIKKIDWNLVYYHAPRVGHAGGISFSTDPLGWFEADSDGSFNLFANFALRERSHYYKPVDPVSGLLQQPTFLKQNQPFISYLVGLSHEAPRWALSSRIEYYYIEDAYGGDSLKTILNGLRDDLPSFYPWIDQLAYGRSQRHYISLAIGQSSLTQNSDSRFTNTLAYGVGALHGLNDHSTLFSLNFTSSYFDRSEIELNILMPVGQSTSEFGTTPFKWRADFSISVIF